MTKWVGEIGGTRSFSEVACLYGKIDRCESSVFEQLNEVTKAVFGWCTEIFFTKRRIHVWSTK